MKNNEVRRIYSLMRTKRHFSKVPLGITFNILINSKTCHFLILKTPFMILSGWWFAIIFSTFPGKLILVRRQISIKHRKDDFELVSSLILIKLEKKFHFISSYMILVTHFYSFSRLWLAKGKAFPRNKTRQVWKDAWWNRDAKKVWVKFNQEKWVGNFPRVMLKRFKTHFFHAKGAFFFIIALLMFLKSVFNENFSCSDRQLFLTYDTRWWKMFF